jgi:hypothetical protein
MKQTEANERTKATPVRGEGGTEGGGGDGERDGEGAKQQLQMVCVDGERGREKGRKEKEQGKTTRETKRNETNRTTKT